LLPPPTEAAKQGLSEEKPVTSSPSASRRDVWSFLILAIWGGGVALGLVGCGDVPIDQKYPKERIPGDTKPRYEDPQSIFGQGGIFGGGDQASAQDGGGGIGVNSLLWRASLDTVSFMPLISADPFGGVIISDWYSPPATPNERFKVNIYILGRQLRADGLRATVFHQVNQGSGWVDAPVAPKASTDLENAILTRARQMRIAGLQQ
jgi:hypothetical protein